ncbi:uncharacterized protein KIAA1671 homolog isoform X2 [Ranitomeya imitator]|uniref:uncharacterized protein KIAA1671 homolog isoform X2 n=1 Tax=Ranitomeya imitator TaxID=111125 RepID=UPI0037E7EF38
MSAMATKVELSTRTTRSDILNEAKPSRTYISPLSDASNKAADTNISTSLITDDIRNLSKTVSMLNTGMKPRLSPKPFSRDKPPESRKSIGMPFTLAGDVKQQSAVPFQATTSISLSGSTKSNESERVGLRLFTSPPQTSTDEDQGNKSEMFSSTAAGRRQNTSWLLRTNSIGESKPNPQTEDGKVTSKPPMMYRKPELSQQEKVFSSYSRRTLSDSVEETRESGEKIVEAGKPDNIDSITVRAQLRQKRRPVSAVFLESNEPTSDQKVVDEPRKWNRRPLSEDLTSLFESRGIVNKKEKPSEETKENRPFTKSFLNSVKDEQSNPDPNEGDYTNAKNFSSDTRTGISGSSIRKAYSVRMEKDKPMEMPSKKQQQIADVGENEGVMKLSANISSQPSKCLPDGSSGDVKKLDDSRIAPGIMRRRISLSIANTSSSEDAEVTSNTEDKSTANTERKSRGLVSDKAAKSGTEWTTSLSPTVSTDLTMFANSPLKSEKLNEERKGSFSSQEYIAPKEKKELENSSILEERTFRPRRSFRRNDEPIRIEGSADVAKDRRQYNYRERLYNAKTEAFEENNMTSTQVDKSVKTVKATLFEHNVERHNAPEIYHSGNLISTQPSKSAVISECLLAKPESSSWSDWLSGDNVQSVSQSQKDLKMKDHNLGEKYLDTTSSTDVGNLSRMALQNFKLDENKRVEPKYEVVQAVTERVVSESIKMAPEYKAVTLRSRPSFHNKDRDLGKDMDEREGSSLQRSKSEYWKRNAFNSPPENSQGRLYSRGTDFSFETRNSSTTEKNEMLNTPSEGFYKIESVFTRKKQTKTNDTDLEGVQEKSFESYNQKEKQENTFGNNCPEYSHFGTGSKSKGEIKTSFSSFSQQSDQSIGSRNSVRRDSEKDIISVKEDPSIISVRDDVNTQIKGYKKQPSFNEFHPQGSLTRNISKESNDFTNIMLNTEIEQIKRELITPRSKKEPDGFLKKGFKEESKGDIMLLKSNDYFQDKEKIGDRTSELYKFEHDDMIPATKDPSPMDKKATYFAVTGVDGKRQGKDSENQISSNTSLTFDESYFKRSGRMAITNSSLDSFTQEAKNADKDIGTSHLSKGFKTNKNVLVLQENLIEKPEKAPERHRVIDIDALLKRQKHKSSIDDKGPSHLDDQTRSLQKSHLITSENTQESNAKGSPVKLDDTYKSKVLDIDSFMADYNASQRKDKENKARDDDHNINKWERSRSFRDNVSKGWRDPSVRHFANDECNKYEAVASRFTSPQETTSTKDGRKQGLSKYSTLLDNFNSFSEGRHEKDGNIKGESGGILPCPNDSQTTMTLESPGRTFNYAAQSTQFFETTVTDSWTTSHTQGKQMLIKVSDDDKNENRVVAYESKSFTHRGSIPEEKTQPLSEGKKAAKASDLINIMLENKEKRMERHRSRQSVPVDHPQEPKMHRFMTSQEWTHSETKEFYKKEEIKPHSARIQEKELTTDLFSRKSLYRHREYTGFNEDHVKQCFSRSSTSNKDTDSLVQETDRQYGTWSQDKQQPEESFVQESSSYDNISTRKQQSHSRLSSLSHTETDQHDSITEVRDGSLDRSSMDLDSTDGTASTPSFHEAKAADFSFMDTSVLDSTALKNRVQLSRKSQRRAPSQSQRRSRLLLSGSQLAVIEDTDSPWMFTDTTEDKPEKPEKKDEVDAEEEKPQRSSLPSQRMPMFPGMDHSTLVAQLRKRQETESSSESSTQPSSPQSSAQPSRSPKSPLPQGTLGVKLLPTSADIQERGASESPQWLKELKSKKRQSQYENHS